MDRIEKILFVFLFFWFFFLIGFIGIVFFRLIKNFLQIFVFVFFNYLDFIPWIGVRIFVRKIQCIRIGVLVFNVAYTFEEHIFIKLHCIERKGLFYILKVTDMERTVIEFR